MAKINTYTEFIETEIHFRARAEYTGRNNKNGIYLQGVMSPQKALEAFRVFGEIKVIQQYVEGKRRTIWTSGRGWNELEGALTNR